MGDEHRRRGAPACRSTSASKARRRSRRIDFFRDDRLPRARVDLVAPAGAPSTGVRVAWRGASAPGNWQRARMQWDGELRIDGARILARAAAGRSIRRTKGVRDATPQRVAWRSVTAGDWDGVVLELDRPDDAELTFVTGADERCARRSATSAPAARALRARIPERRVEMRAAAARRCPRSRWQRPLRDPRRRRARRRTGCACARAMARTRGRRRSSSRSSRGMHARRHAARRARSAIDALSPSASTAMRPDAPPVLGDMSLDVRENEFVVLLGRSGCGKTTLLNIVAGLRARIRRQRARRRRAGARGPGSGKGVVFQQGALFPWLTARAERRVRRAQPRRRRPRERARVRASCSRWSASPAPSASIRSSFPAACSSASPSPARSRSIRRSC